MRGTVEIFEEGLMRSEGPYSGMKIDSSKLNLFFTENLLLFFRDEFRKHKSDIAKQALNSRSGRAIPIKDIEQYQQLEQKKDHEVMLVRDMDALFS